MLVFNELMTWYIPGIIADHRPTLIALGVALGFFAGLNPKDSWQSVKVILLRQNISIVVFIIIYTTFLVISSTTTAYDEINARLLAPIYVPLTLLLIILAQSLVEVCRKRFSNKIVNFFLIIGLAIWLVVPIRTTIIDAVNTNLTGLGYSSKTWIESETIQYLLQHQTLAEKCTVYTNGPDAAYILAQLSAKMSPALRYYNSSEIGNDISKLLGSWPEESNACLIWFDNIKRDYLFVPDKLQAIAKIDVIVRLKDGAIYSVTKK